MSLSEMLACADVSDIQALSRIHSGLEEFEADASDSPPFSQIAGAAARLLETIVTGEAPDGRFSLNVVSFTVNSLLKAFETENFVDLEVPVELGLNFEEMSKASGIRMSPPPPDAKAPYTYRDISLKQKPFVPQNGGEGLSEIEKSLAHAISAEESGCLYDEFVEEALDQVDNCEMALQRIAAEREDRDAFKSCGEAMSAIWNKSKFLSLPAVDDLAACGSEMCAKAAAGELLVDDEVTEALTKCAEALKTLTKSVESSLKNRAPECQLKDVSEIAGKIRRLTTEKAIVSISPEKKTARPFPPPPGPRQQTPPRPPSQREKMTVLQKLSDNEKKDEEPEGEPAEDKTPDGLSFISEFKKIVGSVERNGPVVVVRHDLTQPTPAPAATPKFEAKPSSPFSPPTPPRLEPEPVAAPRATEEKPETAPPPEEPATTPEPPPEPEPVVETPPNPKPVAAAQEAARPVAEPQKPPPEPVKPEPPRRPEPPEPQKEPIDEPEPVERRMLSERTSDTVKADFICLDKLVDLIGELVVAETMVSQSPEVRAIQSPQVAANIRKLYEITRELQSLVPSLKMTKAESLFQKVARELGELSRSSGKDLEFIASGEETEIDKTIIERLEAPALEMLQMAVEFCMETPPERKSAGKPPKGKIQLKTYQKSGDIYMEVRHDGRPLDRRAFERDMKKRLEDLRKNLAPLGGQLFILADEGRGGCLRVRIPHTPELVDGIVVRINGEKYVIPSVSMSTPVSVPPDEIKGGGGTEMFDHKNELVPIFRMEKIFKDQAPAERAPGEALFVVVVERAGDRCAVVIDEVVAHMRVAIKSLGEYLAGIPFLAGGVVAAEGEVILALDPGEIIKAAGNADFGGHS